jgi:CheY-like chemotaxis protein
MNGEFIFMRLLAVCPNEREIALMRDGVSFASIPTEFTAVATSAKAQSTLKTGEIDVVLVDHAIMAKDPDCVPAMRALRQPPAVVALASTRDEAVKLVAADTGADGVVVKPATLTDAKALVERCVKFKAPSRVLVVDDSSTMRSIVRKILLGCRFPLTIIEAGEGVAALKQINAEHFDFVFLDYNMPGLNGFDTLAEIKRQHPNIGVIMMTAAQDAELAERARTAGAAAFLKKPFYPADIDAVLYACHGLRPRMT